MKHSNYCSWIYTFSVVLIEVYSLEVPVLYQPEQIHLSYGKNNDEMVVTWVTQNQTEPSLVEFGKSSSRLDQNISGNPALLFIDGGPAKRSFYIHKVVMTPLKPGTIYYYHVGSPKGWSDMYFFNSKPADASWSPTIAVVGDMGNINAVALPSLQKESQKGTIDIAFHIGDFAYDMDKDNGKVGDAFMNQIQSVAAYIPYMTCVGNHESAYNFSHYRYRFPMPTDEDMKMYYSFNVGSAHIISISTEGYFYNGYKIKGGAEAVKKQYQWLIKDLQMANLPHNRQLYPWIIVMGHRPMYCSNNDGPTEHCNNLYHNPVRTGNPSQGMPGLEALFYKYGVDVQFYAHEHSYERLKPVYNLTVCGGTESMYVNPRAPVHLISGSGGDDEGQTRFDPVVYPWSAFHSIDYGYTRMKIFNKTHIHFEEVSINQGGKVIDDMMLIKTQHGKDLYDCHKSKNT